jgi:SAM-dependent methyltransferase
VASHELSSVWVCRVCCARQGGRLHAVRSSRALPRTDEFSYGECAACGSLSLLDDVDTLHYYSAAYERLRPLSVQMSDGMLGGRQMLRSVADISSMKPFGLVATRWGPRRPAWVGWIRGNGLGRSVSILDVGCGSGALLTMLRDIGFADLAGIDPHLMTDGHSAGVRLSREHLTAYSAESRHDLILFNHSLEHVDDPELQLREAAQRLSTMGRVMVSLPIVGGRPWRTYGESWAALDAPLHRFIPSVEGVELLARRCGMRVLRWHGLSTTYHYAHSEAIRAGLRPDQSKLTDVELKHHRRRAGRDRGRDGGQAEFILTRW